MNLLDEALLGQILSSIDEFALGVVAGLAHSVDLEVENDGQSRSEEIADRQSESKAAPVVDDPVKEIEGLCMIQKSREVSCQKERERER